MTITVNSVQKRESSTWQDAHGRLAVQIPGTLVEDPYGANYGDSVELQGKLQLPLPNNSPGTFASMAFPRINVHYAEGNPIIAFFYHLRVMLATVISQSLPQPEAALLIAILLSLRTAALKPIIPAFNATGCAHLIAPSGFKVTILAGLIASSTRRLYETPKQSRAKLLPAQRRGNWRRWVATTLIVTSIVVYTLLSGVGPAAIRAGIMGVLLVIAPRIGRVYNVYTALALAALLMSLVDPFILWDAGFQLSFLGTLGIVLLTPFFQRWLHPLEHLPLGSSLVEIISATLAAQTATLPLFAVTFHEISFIAPLTNILTVPLLGVLLVLGVFISGAGLLYAPLAALVGWIAQPLLRYMVTVVTWCFNLPWAYRTVGPLDNSVAWIYYAFLTFAVYILQTKSNAPATNAQVQHLPFQLSQRSWLIAQLGAALLLVLATVVTAGASQADGQLSITFLNVGPANQTPQGEAILIRTPGGKTILVDGGLDATSLSQELDSRLPSWQRFLDVVLLTSPRADHLTGLQDIVTRYQIGEIIDAGMLHPSTAYGLWRRTISERNLHYAPVVQGTTITVGTQVALQVLWPTSQLHKGSNEAYDNSLIVRLVAPGVRILLLGVTAQSKYALAGLLATIPPNSMQAEIVQIVGEVNKQFPNELVKVVQQAHPSYVVVTPSSLSAKLRKNKATSVVTLPTALSSEASDASLWQVMQTAQMGTLEFHSGNAGLIINTT